MQIPDLPSGLELVQWDEAAGARAVAIEQARAGADEGTVIAVDRPRRPQGRHGRGWLVPEAPGLHGALLLRPGLPADESAELGPVACVALGRALGGLVAPMTELHYRWPNDVLLNAGKAAGVWLDAAGPAEALDWVAISWAVNTAAAPESLGNEAAALAREGQSGDVDEGELFRTIVRELIAAITTWDESGFEPILRNWRSRMPDYGAVRIRCHAEDDAQGMPLGVDDAGSLSLDCDSGRRVFRLVDFFALGG